MLEFQSPSLGIYAMRKKGLSFEYIGWKLFHFIHLSKLLATPGVGSCMEQLDEGTKHQTTCNNAKFKENFLKNYHKVLNH